MVITDDDGLNPGSLVEFEWWSPYKAPSAVRTEKGVTEWVELRPGDSGLIIYSSQEYDSYGKSVTVLWTRLNRLVRVHPSMLKVLDSLRPRPL